MMTDLSEKQENAARTREHLANERTFLAWIRTSLGLIGLGFVVARIGVLLHDLMGPEVIAPVHSASEFIIAGTLLLSLGVWAAVWAAYTYRRSSIAIDAGTHQPARGSILALSAAVALAGAGLLALVLWRL